MKKIKQIFKYSGFTLIESVVTIFIFSILTSTVMGIFVSALNLQRRSFNIQQVEENANFILESMAKEIRVGTISSPNTNCPLDTSSSLDIIHPVNGSVVYSLSGNDLLRTVNGLQTTVNSNTIQFTSLKFCVFGNINPDQKQPRVTILATIRSTNAQQQVTIDIETTVSQRSLQE